MNSHRISSFSSFRLDADKHLFLFFCFFVFLLLRLQASKETKKKMCLRCCHFDKIRRPAERAHLLKRINYMWLLHFCSECLKVMTKVHTLLEVRLNFLRAIKLCYI